MSGKPAARISDSVVKGVIVTGSRTVLIGSQGGIACSECPGGIKVGSPVNPQLGAKVLLGAEDLDFALPGALPVVWQRQYSSYVNTEHGATCGPLGYGWKLPQQISIELRADAALLFDAAGRTITFDPLGEGEALYSPSEDIWLLRGGVQTTWAQQARWAHLPSTLTAHPDTVLAASGDASVVWIFAPAAQPTSTPSLSLPLRLAAQLDRFGRSQRYTYAEGNSNVNEPATPAGHLTGLTDGVGRQFRLQYQRIHQGQPERGLLHADDGWRLVGVELIRDPLAPLAQPLTLVRYTYNQRGELTHVHDRADQLVREFEWEHHHIRGHRHQGGPWHSYRFESPQPGARVIEHGNEQGLGYRFEYLSAPAITPSPEGKPRSSTRVSDSLGRIETYHFEGEPGVSRLIEHERADGSRMRYTYDGFGRLVASTDPLGRTTRLARDGQGRVIRSYQPDGSQSEQHYDDATGRLVQSTDAAGATTHYRYDDWGRLTEIQQADGSHQRYQYPEPQDSPLTCDSPSAIEDPRGGTKSLGYTSAGQLQSYTDCSGHSSHYRYDRFGDLIEATNALGERQRHERDAQGRITATQLANGQVERYHYNSRGQLVRIEPTTASEASGNTAQPPSAIELAYDLWGRLTQRTHGGLGLGFSYDIAGRLTHITNENAAQSHFAWDAMDRLVQEVGFDTRLQRYAWDAAGQLTAASDGNARYQNTTQYQWDDAGRLKERTLPATATTPAQTHRYQWDKAGRLEKASVYQHPRDLVTNLATQPDINPDTATYLQSQIELQRDTLGRLSTETQRLYRPGPNGQPEVEFEHSISHQFDALGNRQASVLQGAGQIDWQLYGSGHVHGLLHNGASLVDIERDGLHRETQRSLHGPNPNPNPSSALQIQRQWDSLGRLQSIHTQGLGAGATPQPLIGQLSQRRYHYDALGQLAGIQMSDQTMRYGYDAAGRLRGAASSLTPQAPQTITRWNIDPAGNRLPAPSQDSQGPGIDWAAQVHAHWQQEHFNLLGQEQAAPQTHGPVTRWADNRIGYSADAVWRYDACGNRVEQLGQDGRRLILGYDGGHQLSEVTTQGPSIGDGQEQPVQASTSRYTYDALGRRLKKHSEQGKGQTTTTITTHYFGWDGDRLVHTEHIDAQQPQHRQISHTVYEPGSFTPLVRLSTTANGPQAKPHALELAMQDGDDEEERQQVQDMLAGMPSDMRDMMDKSLRQAMRDGLPPSMQAMFGADESQNMAQRLSSMREQLENQEQGKAPIQVHYYHCDHLGTPLALTDQQGNIAWAAKLDPWGNVEEEYNPNHIDQPIRLPGQHHDRETGLYYNRHRYYDPKLGGYINQDPIGWRGGISFYGYPVNPNLGIDPLGLEEVIWSPGPNRSIGDGPRYGNWCGGKWSGGVSGGEVGSAPPLDSMDAICKTHDLCYGPSPSKEQKLTCDATMVKDLKALPDDPKQWPEPTSKGTEKSSKKYKEAAIFIFK